MNKPRVQRTEGTMGLTSRRITYFLFLCLCSLSAPAILQAQSLRELAIKRGVEIGANFSLLVDGKSPNNWQDSPTIQTEMKLAVEHFTVMSAGWQMYPGHSWLGPKQYKYEGADRFIQWCEQNEIRVHGHGLGYGSRVGWLKAYKAKTEEQKSEVREIYESYIVDTATHFKDRVHVWDVCNEQLLPAYVFRGYQTNQAYWQAYVPPNEKPETGIEWYRQTFKLARRSDPAAKLILLDFNNEVICGKSDTMYALVKRLKTEGVPIDGVGFQMHLKTDLNRSKGHGFATDQEYYDSFAANLKRFGELNVDLWITELDVSIDAKNELNNELMRQAEIYGEVVRIALKQPRLKGIKFWGIMDRNTWGEVLPDRPNLFDENGKPKPAFFRVQTELSLTP